MFHAVLLAVQLDAPGLGMPGLELPWQDRRLQAQYMQILLAPPKARTAATAVDQALEAPSRPAPSARTEPPVKSAASPARSAPGKAVDPAQSSAPALPPPPAPVPTVAEATITPLPAAAAKGPRTSPPKAKSVQPKILVQEAPSRETFSVPPPQPEVTDENPDTAAAEELARQQAKVRERQEAEQRAAELAAAERARELERQEALRQEALRQAREAEERKRAQELEEQRQLAAEAEARRLAQEAEARKRVQEAEALRAAELAAAERARELERQEALRQEALRQAREAEERKRAQELEEQRQLAAEAEARRLAQEAEARARAQEAEARRAAEEAARQQSLARERQEAERRGAELAAAERAREAQRQEALRRPDTRSSQKPEIPPVAAPPGSQRRKTLIGRQEQEMDIVIFAEVWRRHVSMRAPFEILEKAKSGSYENPLVTVALRSDGSVEGVTITRSSGVAEIDNAVRQIVMLLAPYARFPREIAVEYDVIEIPSIWTFNRALRLIWGGG